MPPEAAAVARSLLFYTDAFSGGGAETVFARLAGAFADDGDRVVFAADRQGPLVPTDRPGLRHVLVGSSHGAGARRLAALLRRETPDASFSALGAQNLKHLAAATAAGRRRRCILGFHGFAAAEPRRFAQLSYRLAPISSRLAARTICVSDALARDVVARWGAAERRIVRIGNPLPLDAGNGGWEPRMPPLVLAIGRLAPVKRFCDLIDAFAAGAPGDARLVILGDGPERDRLCRRIAALGLDARATLPGYVADPAPWYRQASCLAVTSESESFGLTVAEAFAHGLPVVATDCGGPPEVLDGLGRVVPVGDVTRLAGAIAATLADGGDPAPRRLRAQGFALPRIHEAYARLVDALP